MTTTEQLNVVHVRWLDGQLEVFTATEVRFSWALLWLRLSNGDNRHIPLAGNVRWWAMSVESHADGTWRPA